MRRHLITLALSTVVALSTAMVMGAGPSGGGAAPAAPAPAPAGGSSGSGSNIWTAPTPQGAPSAPTPQGAPSAPTPQGAYTAPTPSGPTANSNPNVGNTNTNPNTGNANTNANTNMTGSGANAGTPGGTVVVPPGADFSGRGPVPNLVTPNPFGPGVFFTGDAVIGGGVLSTTGSTSSGPGAFPTANTVIESTTPVIRVGGDGTVANVPPVGTYNSVPAAQPAAPAGPVVLEGQLVDLYSASLVAGARAAKTAAPAGGTAAARAETDVQVVTSGLHPTPPAPGATAAVSPLPTGGSYGTYARPNAASSSGNIDLQGTTVRSSDGKMSMTFSSSVDAATVSRELSEGVPAAVIVNGQAYILVCDSRQLSSYAGQNVRITGRLTGGTIIPERVDVRTSSGELREAALSLPSETARERALRTATEHE